MLNFCICDDEETILKILAEKISRCMDKTKIQYNIALYTDADKVTENISEFDAVFLDIDFNDSNCEEKGIAIAEQIHWQSPDTQIMFITNRDDLVFKSLKVRPLAFIKKSCFDNEIDDAVSLLLNEIKMVRRSFVFYFKNTAINLKLNDIMYIESLRHDIFIHLSNNNVEKISSTLENLENQLSCYGFVRIHLGYIINCAKVFSIDKKNVILKDNTILPMSRRRADEVKEKFFSFSERS